MILNIPDELTCEIHDDKVKFKINDISSNWIDQNDSFIQRINYGNLNMLFIEKHLVKEITIKNTLDEGLNLLKKEYYSKAIDKFDEVLYYDANYFDALISKSYALYGQKHFVKSLRYYKRAINVNDDGDVGYYRLLLKQANNERDNFPKLKLNIYAGDEYFTKGDFKKAIESYNRALVNPSKFKEKILSKLLNKKATALLKLNLFDDALNCFKESLNNDYSYFGQGFCEYKLDLEINDKFKELLDINKKCQLEQVLILNELEFFTESLKISNYLFENHYKVDDFYFKLLNAKIDSLNGLNKDSNQIEDIVYKLRE